MKSITCLTIVLLLYGCSLDIDLHDLSIPLPVTSGTISFDLKGKSYNYTKCTLTLPSEPANFFGFSTDLQMTDQILLEFNSYAQTTEGQNIDVNFDTYTSGYFSVFYYDSLYQSGNIYGTHGKANMFIEEITEHSARGSFQFAIGRAEGDTLRVTNGKFDLTKSQ